MEYKLEIGASYTAEKMVKYEDTAIALGSGQVGVFATPAMILLMEEAALHAVQAALPEESTTVGVTVNIQHLSATLAGKMVTSTATLKEINGRRLVFDVEASDENGIIGKGTHERVIINTEDFMWKLWHNE